MKDQNSYLNIEIEFLHLGSLFSCGKLKIEDQYFDRKSSKIKPKDIV